MSFPSGPPDAELEGKCGIVTGGASGIGIKCSQLLLHKGAQKLAVLDLNVNNDACRKLVSQYGKSRVVLLNCDVSKAAKLEEAFAQIEKEFGIGSLDFVVNNAGVLDDRDWRAQIDVNLAGTTHVTLLALERLKKGGCLVNVGSLAGLEPSAGCPLYSATGAGVVAMTLAFARPFHWTRRGVRCVCVCPGATYTRMLSGACDKMLDEATGAQWLKELSQAATQQPENVAACVAHAVGHADNGDVWAVDGGQPPRRVQIAVTAV